MTTIDISPVPVNAHLVETTDERKGLRFEVWNNSDKARQWGWVRPTISGKWVVTDTEGNDWSKLFDGREDAVWLLVQFRGAPDPFQHVNE